MDETTMKRLKRLLAEPPRELTAILERLDRCDDPRESEDLHFDLSRILGGGLLAEHLERLDRPPGQCPHCAASATPAGEEQAAGVSPP